MGQDAGDVVLGHFGQVVFVLAVEEAVPGTLEEGLMDVHPAPVMAEDRLRHECRVDAVLPGDFLHCRPVGHHVVRHAERLVVAKIDFMLARGDLVVAVFDTDPHILEREDRLAAQIGGPVHGEAVEISAHVEKLGGLVRGEIEELEFRADIEGIALLVDLLKGPLQDVAGIALVGCSVGILDVADHPRHRTVGGTPGDDLEGGRIGHCDHVALLDPAESGDGGAVKTHPLLEPGLQFAGGDAEDLLNPKDIGEPELDEADIPLFDGFQYIFLRFQFVHGLILSWCKWVCD